MTRRRVATTATPTVGAIGLMRMPGPVGALIRTAQWLNGDGWGDSEHAVVCTAVSDGGWALCVQAMPGGANERWYGPSVGVTWSDLPLTERQRHRVLLAARSYLGTPYSALDYVALLARRLRVPAPHLRQYIASSRHMICSQLADQAYTDADIHLFNDGRWPGYVTPRSLRRLFEGQIQ